MFVAKTSCHQVDTAGRVILLVDLSIDAYNHLNTCENVPGLHVIWFVISVFCSDIPELGVSRKFSVSATRLH